MKGLSRAWGKVWAWMGTSGFGPFRSFFLAAIQG